MKTLRNVKKVLPSAGNGVPRHREAGTSLLELALLMPAILLLTLATVDLGRLGYMSIEVSNAARAAAAYGAQSHFTAVDSAGMVQAAKNDAPDLSGLNASATYYCSCYVVGGGASGRSCVLSTCMSGRLSVYVQVTTTATYTPWFSYKGSPSSWTLNGAAIMRAGN